MPQAIPKRWDRRGARTQGGVIALCFALTLALAGCRHANQPTASPEAVAAPSPFDLAVAKVEADRGEPIGRDALVAVPSELKHYSDRRRFLAVQAAEFHHQRYELPLDYADLVSLIRSRQLVELKMLDADYILYGVGSEATDAPFTHYDAATGEDVPLFATDDEFKNECDHVASLIKEPQARLVDLERASKSTPQRDRARRAVLMAQAVETRQTIAALAARKQLLESFYNNLAKRRMLGAEYRTLAEFAASFQDHAYDLNDPAERRALKIRLLGCLRPQARKVLLEIARAYNAKFNRPLPITSLMRHAQYQKHLSETNANAARNAAPPHTTGLAFDVYYHYMTAAEQDYLMSVIARLKGEGRVEALRETRDHIHVFVFPDGKRPAEKLIAQQINQTGAKSRK